MGRQCRSCGKTFIPDVNDDLNYCWDCLEDGCDLCDEMADDNMGEFYDPVKNCTFVAHAQCGLDAGLEIA